MFRNTRLQMMAVLAVGVLLGYLAATGRLNPFAKAGAAAQSEEASTSKPTEAGNSDPAC